MKMLNTPTMHAMVQKAIRKIRRKKIHPPPEGTMYSILYRDSRRGHWQVEYIRDSRFFKKPYIAAYYFKGHSMLCRYADYCLHQELSN